MQQERDKETHLGLPKRASISCATLKTYSLSFPERASTSCKSTGGRPFVRPPYVLESSSSLARTDEALELLATVDEEARPSSSAVVLATSEWASSSATELVRAEEEDEMEGVAVEERSTEGPPTLVVDSLADEDEGDERGGVMGVEKVGRGVVKVCAARSERVQSKGRASGSVCLLSSGTCRCPLRPTPCALSDLRATCAR